MITRVRNGKLEIFKPDAYQQEPRVQKVIDKLASFGYNRLEGRELAKKICQSLDNYIGIQEAVAQHRQRVYDNHTRPTQTTRGQSRGNL
jgi:hypothetical protein